MKINYLLSALDNIETIRNQIAAILKIEIDNQIELAKNAEDKNDYSIDIFVGRLRPWDLTGENKEKSPFPLINILLDHSVQNEKPGSAVDEKKYTATFFIDCYGCGNVDGNDYDDSLSTIRAWKTARIARNILMAGHYIYLGLKGIVRKREIIDMSTGAPRNLPESSISVTVCRLTFSVDYSEKSPQAEGVPNEGILFKSLSDSGEILIDI